MEQALGRYQLLRVLGRGAMGVVYEGIDPKLNRQVAVKTILKSQLVDPGLAEEYTKRFMREAQAVARLNHPNIVTVFDFGNEADVTYLVMEFIRGKELKGLLEEKRLLGIEEVVSIVAELLDALGYAHERGVIHRDIKPANVMLETTGRVKLTDFGVARLADSSGMEGTRPGTMVGTPGYMAPEQIKGLSVGPQADLFATGVLLYQCLTLQKPFTGSSDWEVYQKIVNEDPPPLAQFREGIPPALEDVVRRALAKEPRERYPDAAAMATALRQSISGRIFDDEATRLVYDFHAMPASPPEPSFISSTSTAGASSAAASRGPSTGTTDAERDFWNSIKDSGDIEELREFLVQFPNSLFANLARIRINKLSGGTTGIEASGLHPPVDSTVVAEKAPQAANRPAASEGAQSKGRDDARQKAEEEARRQVELEMQRRAQKEARRQIEEDARHRAEEEAARKAEDDARKRAASHKQQEHDDALKAEARRREEEQARQRAAEEARRRDEEAERRRQQKAEEDARIAAEQASRRQAEETARREAEARQKAEEEARRQAGEEARRREMEAARRAEEEARIMATLAPQEQDSDRTVMLGRAPMSQAPVQPPSPAPAAGNAPAPRAQEDQPRFTTMEMPAKKSKLPLIVGGAVLVLGIAGAAMFLGGGDKKPPETVSPPAAPPQTTAPQTPPTDQAAQQAQQAEQARQAEEARQAEATRQAAAARDTAARQAEQQTSDAATKRASEQRAAEAKRLAEQKTAEAEAKRAEQAKKKEEERQAFEATPEGMLQKARAAKRKHNMKEAIKLYTQAYNAGSSQAAKELGDYYKAPGPDQDSDFAELWYSRARQKK